MVTLATGHFRFPPGASDQPLGGLGFANGSGRHYAQP